MFETVLARLQCNNQAQGKSLKDLAGMSISYLVSDLVNKAQGAAWLRHL